MTLDAASIGADPVPHSRLPGLDWIRGAASMWVLFYHLDITVQKAKYFGLPPVCLVSSVGYRGVELFFLLSGFVMARTYSAQNVGSWRGACAFVGKRVLRIFPAYLIVFIPLFAAAAWKGLGAPPDVPMGAQLFFQNLLLLPRDNLTTFIPVSAWTLSHELMFYGLFMVSFLSWRWFLILLTIWGLGSVALFAADVRLTGWAMPTSSLNAYFLIGLLCALTKWRCPKRWVPAFAGVTVASLMVAIGLEGLRFDDRSVGHYFTQLTYALAFALIVLGLSRPGLSLPSLATRIASYLGRISYGLYLVNYPVIVVIVLLVKAAGVEHHIVPLVGFFAVVVSILLADVIYRFVELPTIAYGKKLFWKMP